VSWEVDRWAGSVLCVGLCFGEGGEEWVGMWVGSCGTVDSEGGGGK